MSDAPRKPAPMPSNPLFATLIWTLRSIIGLIFALFLSVVIQLAGLTWWWPDEGIAHTEQMLERELSYLSGDFRNSLISASPVMLAQRAGEIVYH